MSPSVDFLPVHFAPHKRADFRRLDPGKRDALFRQMLSRALDSDTTVAFVGAGCSAPLGYPTWTGFAQSVLAQLHARSHSGGPLALARRIRQVLEKFKKDSSHDPSTDRILYALGAAQRAFQEADREDIYYEAIANVIHKCQTQAGRARKTAWNPYQSIFGLPIKRFATSNYDHELDMAAYERLRRRVPGFSSSVAEFLKTHSFTQEETSEDQLARFVLARTSLSDDLVFHCHGRYDRPHSMVVTERDYQRWYFSDQMGGGTHLRQTMELVFGSNPILFLGFGLKDEDLLLVLRVFSAAEPTRKLARPLFALLPLSACSEEYIGLVQDRYGVNVITFDDRECNSPQDRGKALAQAIERIREDWKAHKADWLRKPPFKPVEVSQEPPQKLVHHDTRPKLFRRLTKHPLILQMEHWLSLEKGRPRVIVLTGPGGSGKSWFALQLLDVMSASQKAGFEAYFYWSSYYVDDPLTGLERLLRYLNTPSGDEALDPPDDSGPILERLRRALSKPCLIVLDGAERLLTENSDHGVVTPSSAFAEKLFETLADPGSKSTVVLTSRSWLTPDKREAAYPDMSTALQESDTKKLTSSPCWRVAVPPPTVSEVVEYSRCVDRSIKAAAIEASLSSLISVLDGHRYALSLAIHWLKKRNWAFQDLFLRLAKRSPQARLWEMIRLAINQAESEGHSSQSPRKLLERLSIHLGPIRADLVADSFGLAKDRGMVNKSLQKLEKMHLLFALEDNGESRYVIHPTVRDYVLGKTHDVRRSDWPTYQLLGYSAGDATPDPGTEMTARAVRALFDHLVGLARKSKKSLRSYYLRKAFGVLRSQMCALSTPRWGHMDDYIQIVTEMLDLCRELEPTGRWMFSSDPARTLAQPGSGLLFGDEVAWLYNDLGLAYLLSGELLDALAVWEEGYEVNKALRQTGLGQYYTFQSYCNLGAAYIQYGRLGVAESYLLRALEANRYIQDADHDVRIRCYLDIIKQYRGNSVEAEAGFRDLLELVLKPDTKDTNHRISSIARRHLAEIVMQHGEIAHAERLLDQSRIKAEGGRSFDLVAQARLTRGVLYRRQKLFSEALSEFQGALSFAHAKGLRGLQADAECEWAKVALDLGDSVVAMKRAMQSLQIANECTMGLRQTRALIVLGQSSIQAKKVRLGRSYLRHAQALAESQEFGYAAREAEAALAKIRDGEQ